jgi:hypothetical protein
MDETVVVQKTDGLPLSEGVTLTPTGAEISNTITLDSFLQAVKNANTLTTASLWALGDLLFYGEHRSDWGETYTQALDLSNRSAWTLSQSIRLSKAYPLTERIAGVSWSHHRDALHLKDRKARRELLERAAALSLSREEMKGEMGLSLQPRKSDPAFHNCPKCGHQW